MHLTNVNAKYDRRAVIQSVGYVFETDALPSQSPNLQNVVDALQEVYAPPFFTKVDLQRTSPFSKQIRFERTFSGDVCDYFSKVDTPIVALSYDTMNANNSSYQMGVFINDDNAQRTFEALYALTEKIDSTQTPLELHDTVVEINRQLREKVLTKE